MPSAEQELQFVLPRDAQSIRLQLHALVTHEALRTSRRSVAFLRYIVEETLAGHSEELKERTIGVHVFGKPLTYDTNLDHVVRTAASELRKRLATYYSVQDHQHELRILLMPGSYVPVFRDAPLLEEEPAPAPRDSASLRLPDTTPADQQINPTQIKPTPAIPPTATPHPAPWAKYAWSALALPALFLVYLVVNHQRQTPQALFWEPLLRAKGPVLIAVGEVPNGPPTADPTAGIVLPTPPHSPAPTLPLADAIAMARVAGYFEKEGKEVILRREQSSTFADLRDRPVVLIGAFNNQWGLRLAQDLYFSFALDPVQRVLYIRDRAHPELRAWSWSIDPHPGERDRAAASPLYDYALISRVLDSETGHEVILLGGLSTYGTQAAGEFVASPQLLSLTHNIPLENSHHRLQIVLRTQVTEGTPGPPTVVAFHAD